HNYRNLAKKINNLYFLGRLADFKYYNMDQAIKRALLFCSKYF
ncbi:UDP-galactopyranose mutase, partial [Campylobacter jejuni]|nr:UDP-galactopyranose mutase [Campylobacter jejuni]